MQTAPNAGYPVSQDISAELPEGFSKGEVTIDKRGRRLDLSRLSASGDEAAEPCTSRPTP